MESRAAGNESPDSKASFFPPQYWIPAASVVMLLVGLGLLFIEMAPGRPLSAADTEVLGDFRNLTKDDVLSGALRAALSISLDQSPFLKIASDERMSADARAIGRPPTEHLSDSLAHEICQREKAKAMLSGTIEDLGNAYAIALTAINCAGGAVLAREQTEAINRELAIKALSKAATGLRAKLGESQGTIQKYDRPIDQIASGSLQALKAYASGEELLARGEPRAGMAFYRRAVELDPQFAMAYVRLRFVCAQTGDPACAKESGEKALALASHLNERQRLGIAAVSTRDAGDLAKAIEISDQWAKTYPRDPQPREELAAIYESQGNTSQAAQERAQAATLK